MQFKISESMDKVLVYRVGSLGDTVVALPCFHKVREYFPTADITLLTNRPIVTKAAPVESVLGSGYFFDRVLNYPIGTRNPLILAKLIGQIRSLGITTVIDLTTARSRMAAQRDRWFFRAAGISRLIGFPTGNKDFDLLDPLTGEYEWEAQRLARRLHALGPIALATDQYWDLRFSEKELFAANQALSQFVTEKPILAVSVGTKMQAKDWGVDNWFELLSQLKSVLSGWQLVMIGAADEADLSDTVLKAWNGAGINLCGQLSPRVSAAVLKRAALFIGHDSGPMHLAGCVGIPCVAIFSARVLPRQWYPRGNFNKIIYHKTDCAGCRLEVCIEQRKKCILSISVAEVQQAVLEIVNNRSHQIRLFDLS